VSADRSRFERRATPAFLAGARILRVACFASIPSLETALITRDNGEPREPAEDGNAVLCIAA